MKPNISQDIFEHSARFDSKLAAVLPPFVTDFHLCSFDMENSGDGSFVYVVRANVNGVDVELSMINFDKSEYDYKRMAEGARYDNWVKERVLWVMGQKHVADQLMVSVYDGQNL